MQELNKTEAFDRIRERAYAIWQSEGCPDGCAERHWSAAEGEILHSDAARDRDTTRAVKPDAADAELRANAYGQREARPDNAQRRKRG
jgi:hypothetical protein